MKPERPDDLLQRHSIEVGCDGLQNGIAVQKDSGEKVHASHARKQDGPFYCQECYAEAIHRYCTEIRHHFAHYARTSSLMSEESELHRECKTAIFYELKRKFPQYKWVCDNVVIRARPEEKLCALKPDIGGRIKDRRVAIEIQSSFLTLPRLLKRSLSYAARGVSILWIVPLTEPLGEKNFRPRLFERFLHSIYYGRTYYWFPGLGSQVLPVHYSPAFFHIPYREWHDENGDEQNAGGFDVPYKRIRRPMPYKAVDIATSFVHRNRKEHRPWNELKTVPTMRILMDNIKPWWDPKEFERLERSYLDNDGEEF